MQCKVTHYNLSQALEKVKRALTDCKKNRIEAIHIIHGLSETSVLKYYFRSFNFRKAMLELGYNLVLEKKSLITNHGRTTYRIKFLNKNENQPKDSIYLNPNGNSTKDKKEPNEVLKYLNTLDKE